MKSNNSHYDIKVIVRYLGLLAVGAAFMKATSGVGTLAFAIGLIIGIFSRKPMLQVFCLMTMICAVVGNYNFFPKNMVFYTTIRVCFLLIGIIMLPRVANGRKSPLAKPFLWLLPYLGWEYLVSIAGFCPPVSYLKLTLFTPIYLAFYAIANEMSFSAQADMRKIRSVMLVFVIFFVVGSVCLIPFPSVSQLRWDLIKDSTMSLFMGTSAHSQALGPIVALINAFILADMLFSIKKFDRLYVLILVLVPILILKTSSRTAMGSYLAGCLMVIFCISRARKISLKWKRRVLNCGLGIGALLVVALLATESGRGSAANFIAKREVGKGDSVTADDMVGSRAFLVEIAMQNFRDSPLLGNGFQVDEPMKGLRNVPFKEYLAAPVEKGVWLAAVLEEGGAIGFVLFSAFIFGAIGKLVNVRAYMTASVLFTFMVTNLGEFIFFSMSYLGGFGWVMVFMSVVMDAQRLRSEKNMGQRQALAANPYER